MEDRYAVRIVITIAVGLVCVMALAIAGSAVDGYGRRQRLELVLKQLERHECAPLTVDLVRELAK